MLEDPAAENRAKKKGGEWVFTTHELASPDLVIECIKSHLASGMRSWSSLAYISVGLLLDHMPLSPLSVESSAKAEGLGIPLGSQSGTEGSACGALRLLCNWPVQKKCNFSVFVSF